MIGFDPTYFLIVGPGMLLALWATFKVKRTFARFSRVRAGRDRSGAEVAREILDRNNLHDVRVVETRGVLSDHYDPRSRTVNLSKEVYRTPSVAAIAVAAHEVGHALQHARGYAPLALRSAAVPLANIGSWAPYVLIMIGVFMHMLSLVYLGIFLFAGIVLFQIITLPVELNASRRAGAELERLGLATAAEGAGVRSVLSAAALTYVAAAITSVLTLVYFLGFARRE
jgi:Zn-dependent membrane protease YugP